MILQTFALAFTQFSRVRIFDLGPCWGMFETITNHLCGKRLNAQHDATLEKPDCKQRAWLVDIDDVIKEAEREDIRNNRTGQQRIENTTKDDR